jgi:hypothetical protein
MAIYSKDDVRSHFVKPPWGQHRASLYITSIGVVGGVLKYISISVPSLGLFISENAAQLSYPS